MEIPGPPAVPEGRKLTNEGYTKKKPVIVITGKPEPRGEPRWLIVLALISLSITTILVFLKAYIEFNK